MFATVKSSLRKQNLFLDAPVDSALRQSRRVARLGGWNGSRGVFVYQRRQLG